MSDESGLTVDAQRADSRASAEASVAAASPAAPPQQEDGRKRRYMDQEDRSRRIKAQLLCVLTILTGLGYLGWIIFALNPDHLVLGIGFLQKPHA